MTPISKAITCTNATTSRVRGPLFAILTMLLAAPQFAYASGVVSVWRQGSSDIFGRLPDVPEPWDGFGLALASGDFNCDGRDDLAVGAPNEGTLWSDANGMVNILYGSSSGLTTQANQSFAPGMPGLPVERQSRARFGAALAAGDIDGNGCDDLVVGVPGLNVGTAAYAGAMFVLFGSTAGVTTEGAARRDQSDGRNANPARTDDGFAETLASADLNSDGFDDIVVGSPSDDDGIVRHRGSVEVFFGRQLHFGRYFGERREYVSYQNPALGLPTSGGVFGELGASFSIGYPKADGRPALAIGAPGACIDGDYQPCGAVHVLHFSTGNGFTVRTWTPLQLGFRQDRRPQFGRAVSFGQFVDGAEDDLAISSPSMSLASQNGAGVVHVLPGSHLQGIQSVGMLAFGAVLVQEAVQAQSNFGETLARLHRFDGTPDDLLIGTPRLNRNTAFAAGVVSAARLGISRPIGTFAPRWLQGESALPDTPESDDKFGRRVITGDFNGDGFDDVAISAPGEDSLAGAVFVELGPFF